MSFLVGSETSSCLTPYYSLSFYKRKLYELLTFEPPFHGTLARLQKLQTSIFRSILSKLEHSNFPPKRKFPSRHVDDQISPAVNSEQRYILRMTPKALGSVRTSILRHLKFSKFDRQIVILDGAFSYHKCNYISI